MVDKIRANTNPIRVKLSIIDAGLGNGILPAEISKKASELVETWKNKEEIPEQTQQSITEVYSNVKDLVHGEQMRLRNRALVESGIPDELLPGMRVPYRYDPDLKLVLALDQVVIPKLDEYYEKTRETKPSIMLYGSLVGKEPLEDTHTGGMETARSQVKYFLETQEQAMEKIVEILEGN